MIECSKIRPLISPTHRGSCFTISPSFDRMRLDLKDEVAGFLGRSLWLAMEKSPLDITVGEWVQTGIRRREREYYERGDLLLNCGRSPRLSDGRALCVGIASYASSFHREARAALQEKAYLGPRNFREAPQFAGLALQSRSFEVTHLLDHSATRASILWKLETLLSDHDKELPFILWISGVAMGYGEGLQMLAWDAPINHPEESALDIPTLERLLTRVPHWALVLDAAWSVSKEKCLGWKDSPDNKIRPVL